MIPNKYMAVIGESIECLIQEYITHTVPSGINPQYVLIKMTLIHDMLVEMPDLFVTPRAKQEFFEAYFNLKLRLEGTINPPQ